MLANPLSCWIYFSILFDDDARSWNTYRSWNKFRMTTKVVSSGWQGRALSTSGALFTIIIHYSQIYFSPDTCYQMPATKLCSMFFVLILFAPALFFVVCSKETLTLSSPFWYNWQCFPTLYFQYSWKQAVDNLQSDRVNSAFFESPG